MILWRASLFIPKLCPPSCANVAAGSQRCTYESLQLKPQAERYGHGRCSHAWNQDPACSLCTCPEVWDMDKGLGAPHILTAATSTSGLHTIPCLVIQIELLCRINTHKDQSGGRSAGTFSHSEAFTATAASDCAACSTNRAACVVICFRFNLASCALTSFVLFRFNE